VPRGRGADPGLAPLPTGPACPAGLDAAAVPARRQAPAALHHNHSRFADALRDRPAMCDRYLSYPAAPRIKT